MKPNLGSLNFLNTSSEVMASASQNSGAKAPIPNLLGTLLLILFSLFSNAEDFTHNITVDNANPYLKEAIILKVDLNQTNSDIVLFFNFDLKKSEEYSFKRVGVKESDKYHNTQVGYTYLLYPLKSGSINLNFNLKKRVTTDDSIAYSFSGDRDTVKGLVTTDSTIKIKPITLNVQPLPKGTQLIGDFTLNYKVKTHEALSYEPLPFEVSLTGTGYPPLLQNILNNENNITLFSEKPQQLSTHMKEGTKNKFIYPMALSYHQNFSLEETIIKAFNPKTKKSYELTIPKQIFKIQQVETKILVDKVDSPKAVEVDFSWLSSLFSYLIIFGAGYLTALSLKWKQRTSRIEINLMKSKIKNVKDEKELLQILMASNNRAFNKGIKELEALIYGKSNKNFKNIQNELLKEV
jgi:hypothetical protein